MSALLVLISALLSLAGALLIYLANPHQRLRRAGAATARLRWGGGLLALISWGVMVPSLGASASLALALSAVMVGLVTLPFIDAVWRRRRGTHGF